jgi:3-oxoacyl-[acyl-carrier-protein] synthase-1
MKPVYIAADNIFSPIGQSTATNFQAVVNGVAGIKQITTSSLSENPIFASLFSDNNLFGPQNGFTRFESICIASISAALEQTQISLEDSETLFILSTTKGNIELIEERVDKDIKDKVSLLKTAERIGGYFRAANQPVVVSNACISGVMAIILATRLLNSGKYKHVVITGADVISRFIVAGFQSLSAMSNSPCMPFDKSRDGINLGECAATMVVTTNALLSDSFKLHIDEGSITNDANHISGPSRTGLELSTAINRALKNVNISSHDLSSISAHGTATVYNDDMEAKAFALSGLCDVPLYSLKGNFGHTLGAAGILESILAYRSLQNGIILPSKNFKELGVAERINVNTTVAKSTKRHVLKTASGFGGCNAAIIYSIA